MFLKIKLHLPKFKRNYIQQKDPNFSIRGMFPLLHNEHPTSVNSKHFIQPSGKVHQLLPFVNTVACVNHMSALMFGTSLISIKRRQANTS